MTEENTNFMSKIYSKIKGTKISKITKKSLTDSNIDY